LGFEVARFVPEACDFVGEVCDFVGEVCDFVGEVCDFVGYLRPMDWKRCSIPPGTTRVAVTIAL
jgi:hypothetical protein